jgi:cyclophilin family peptidyl-prolyl cis-trans isomerase
VKILDADQAAAQIVAPSLQTAQTLTFAVTVRDSAGVVGQASVSIQIALDPNYLAYDPNTNPSVTPGATGPTANAGPDERAVGGTSYTLDGSESRGGGLTYLWRQVLGRTVTLSDASSVSPSFTVPDFIADGDNLLRFELAVTDRNNRTVTDRVDITIGNPDLSDRQVRIETNYGTFTVELNPELAPITTANFLQYVDDGFYDSTIFHRVIAGFVVQGGGFNVGLTAKETRGPIANESSNGLQNDRGTIAMARTDDPNSATSQWFVNLVDNDFLNRSDTNAGYCVFGRVIDGMSVLDQIATVETGSVSGFEDVPLTDVILRTARRVSSTD